MLAEWLLLGLGVTFVLACGAFVAAEFSFIAVDRATVEKLAASGDRGARGVLTALHGLSSQLSGSQVGITVTNLAIGLLAEPSVAALVEQPLTALGLPEAGVPAIAVVLALLVSSAITMVFGELVPKNLAIAHPLGTARTIQVFMRVFTTAAGPLIGTLNGSANGILRAMGVTPQEELASARSPQELASVVRRSAQQGTLPTRTAQLLERSLAFGDKTARDAMTPRVRMLTVLAGEPVSTVIEESRRTGHSQFPAIGEAVDDVVGIAHVKHAVTVPAERRERVPIRSVMAEPVLVPSFQELDTVLGVLRGNDTQMAVVVDEFGGVEGLVTFEDLIEEIAGDITDEHDRPGAHARRRRDGSWSVSGLLRPDEVAAATGIELPEDGSYDTLGGLVAVHLGRVAEVDDVVTLENVRLVVERMDALRVDRVRLQPLAVDDEATEREARG